MKHRQRPLFLCLLVFAVFSCGFMGFYNEVYGWSAQGDIFDDVRSRMTDAVGKSRVPSLSVAVAHRGKIVWEEAFGWANIEKKIEATPHTLYSLASISKPITATGLMALVEKGLIDLNKPANHYLGNVQLRAFAGDASEATVRRLLHHTAGLAIHWNFFYEGDAYKRPAMEESIRRYGILVVPPGVLFNYANFGFGILEFIIEQVSGQSYRDFMKKEVFLPLSLNNMDIFTAPFDQDNVAERYLGKTPIPFYDFDHRGASAVYSSAHDLVRFGMFHLKNHLEDQEPILEDTTIMLMQEDVDPNLPEVGYRLGWATGDLYGYKIVSHSGGMPGVSTTLQLLPEEDIAVVVLCNASSRNLSSYVQDIIAALIPDFAEKRDKEREKPEQKPEIKKVEIPQELIGFWEGNIYTHSGETAVEMEFKENRKVFCLFLGEKYKDMRPLGAVGPYNFREDGFNGSFNIPFPTEDGSREKHNILIDLKLIDGSLTGVVSAVATNTRYRLPAYIKLAKRRPAQAQTVSSSETDPQIVEMPSQKMAVVYTKGDPNVVAQQAIPALYGSVFGLGGELAKKGIKFQMQAPRARWPNATSAPRDEWIGIWGLPVPDEVESIPQTTEDIEVKLEVWPYGTMAQILHVGPYETESNTIEVLMNFLLEMGYEVVGPHEEEYLTMPDVPEQKTLIRYPVQKK